MKNIKNKKNIAGIILLAIAVSCLSGAIILSYDHDIPYDEDDTTVQYASDETDMDTAEEDEILEWNLPGDPISYGDTIIMYDEIFPTEEENDYDYMAQYFWKNIDKYINVPDGIFPLACSMEIRTKNLYRVHYDEMSFQTFIELEKREEKYYIKISDGENNMVYLLAQLSPSERKNEYGYGCYDITVTEVSYEEIKDKVTVFTDEVSPYIDNETYCQYLIEKYKKDGIQEIYGQPVTVEALMKKYGYSK